MENLEEIEVLRPKYLRRISGDHKRFWGTGDAALARWRKWLNEGSFEAIRTFFEFNGTGKEHEPGGVGWVKDRLDYTQIEPSEWEKLVEKSIRMEVLGADGAAMAVKRAIVKGIGYGYTDDSPFRTWRALWSIDEILAFELIGDAGFRRFVLPKLPKELAKDYNWRKNSYEITGVAVWSMGEDNIPIVKNLVVEDIKDLQPLFMSKNKEVRLLAAQLAESVSKRREAVKKTIERTI